MSDEEREEWEMPPQPEQLSIAPEDHDLFRRLLTEVAFSAGGVIVFGITAAWIHDPKPRWTWPPSPPPSLWERALYQWLPPFLLFLAFVCLVWLITIPMRMANLKRK